MAELSKDQIKQMARLVGLEVDDLRAETISLRLASVMTELDEIPSEALAEVEPALTFTNMAEVE